MGMSRTSPMEGVGASGAFLGSIRGGAGAGGGTGGSALGTGGLELDKEGRTMGGKGGRGERRILGLVSTSFSFPCFFLLI